MAHFTDRELDVMGVLWQRGASTVSEVRAALTVRLAYTTVLTVLRTLEEKGFVGHREEGKAYRYYARVTSKSARRTALARVLDKVFGGSAELLLTHLVTDTNLSTEEVKRLRGLIDEAMKRSQKS
jgi:predicted transcriptional regulator